jgi:hypothetical protein
MGDTPRPPTISTTRQRIAQQAIQCPAMVFTTLAHLMDSTGSRKPIAGPAKIRPGIDGVTAAAYAEHLEANTAFGKATARTRDCRSCGSSAWS